MAAVMEKAAVPRENGVHKVFTKQEADSIRISEHDRSLLARFDHALASIRNPLGSNPQVYAIGGLGEPAESPSLDVHVLDSENQSWEAVATTSTSSDLNPTSRGCQATAVVGDRVYLIGGYGGGTTLDEVLELNTATKEWSLLEVTGVGPGAVSGATATAVGDRIYVFGGAGSDHAPRNTVHILDTKEHTWLTPHVLGDPPPARCAHTATLVGPAPSKAELDPDTAPLAGDRIMILGGYGAKPLGDAWFLEVATPFVNEQVQERGGAVVAWSQVAAGTSTQTSKRRPVVICGPSGVGKGTLINKLMAEFPGQLGFSVSHTTRKPRKGEQDGVHYHFTEKADFEREIAAGKFLEYAHVHDNIYGTSIAAVDAVGAAGRTCILDIDVQGAQLVKKSPLEALFIFIMPPSQEELEKRLRGRGTEEEEQVQKRLRAAAAEMARASDASLFDHTLVNDDLDKCYARLKQLLGMPPAVDAGEGLPGARSGHTATALGGRVLVYGGVAAGPSPLSDVHLLDVSNLTGGAPEATTGLRGRRLSREDFNFDRPFLPEARYNHKAVGLSASEVLLVGGYDGGNALGSTATLRLAADGR